MASPRGSMLALALALWGGLAARDVRTDGSALDDAPLEMAPPPNATLGQVLDILCGQTGTTYDVDHEGTLVISMK